MSSDKSVRLWKDREPSLRAQVEELTSHLDSGNPPPSTVSDAVRVIENLRKGARDSNLESFKQFDAALREMAENDGVDPSSILSFVDRLIEESDLVMVERKRIDLAKQVSGVADAARLRGLWTEYLLLRSIAWIIIEPTGMAAVALRQQMYSEPVTIPLLKEFYGGDSGPIGAATDFAMTMRNLARSITSNISPLN